MMAIRLNGWQRIGLIASVIWLFVGAFWGNSIGIHEGDWAVSMYKLCLKIHPEDWTSCGQKFDHDYVEAVRYHWYYAAFVAIVPIPIGWLLTWGIVSLVRWIKAGFRPSNSN